MITLQVWPRAHSYVKTVARICLSTAYVWNPVFPTLTDVAEAEAGGVF